MTELSTGLAGIQNLLLRPGPSTMREVERRLGGLITGIRESRTTEFDSGVGASLLSITFLLDRAKQFWDRRRVERSPGLQYSAGGALVENPSKSTFDLEV